MAMPRNEIPYQDMPPKGGYPKIATARNLPNRGPPGWALWLGLTAAVTYGFVGLVSGNKRRNAMAREKREARMNIQAYLQAEADLQHLAFKDKFTKIEDDTMGHVLGWKVGESVYKSGIYMPPTINMGWPDDLIRK